MRICILSIDFLPNIGGIAAHVYELSKALSEKGDDIHILTFRNKYSEKKYVKLGNINTHRIYLPKIGIVGKGIYMLLEYLTLIKLNKKFQFDILHSHNLLPDNLITMLFKSIPSIITEHSSQFLNAFEKNKSILFIYKKIMKKADLIIGPSNELVNTFNKIGISNDKTVYIPNGVDINKFKPMNKPKDILNKYEINEDSKIILCPRRLAPKNGVEYLIKALPNVIEKFQEIKCLIVGDGSEFDKLNILVAELDLKKNVIFTGRIPNSEMPKYYAASDIVVLPSIIEATSIAGLEAMSMGKPLIGTNVGGIPQIIDDEKTGIIVPPKNSKELGKAILTLILNDSRCHEFGYHSRKRVETEFSWYIISERIRQLYQNLLCKSTRK